VHRLYDRVFAGGESPSFERRCRANLSAHIGYLYLQRGQVKLAFPNLWRSIRHDPRRVFTLPVRALFRRLGRRTRLWGSGRSSGWTS
jgi:Tfp pilus assembly protein PilF